MADDTRIDDAIRRYIRLTIEAGQFPTRAEAIRFVTGEQPVMPSDVAKRVTAMIEAGTLTHGNADRLHLKG